MADFCTSVYALSKDCAMQPSLSRCLAPLNFKCIEIETAAFLNNDKEFVQQDNGFTWKT